jgi:hypothetical protein
METAAKGGQAKPESGNATSFNWWIFTILTLVVSNIKLLNHIRAA